MCEAGGRVSVCFVVMLGLPQTKHLSECQLLLCHDKLWKFLYITGTGSQMADEKIDHFKNQACRIRIHYVCRECVLCIQALAVQSSVCDGTCIM